MTEDREFTGHATLMLYASTDQADMDVIVKLSLVPGDPGTGSPVKVSQGWLRASHRAEDPEGRSTNSTPRCCRCRSSPVRATACGWRSPTRTH
ncbi:CocE/NonD family hydrolase C-terminal non-catalytic domain-containing protein [Streptomyces sp. NPDC007851]|uniref:CocE/NonD family hydrolase C-terminal non-catalytic domain-containing protein n=1 Tax=Streptomyces sp. NPDC007851 TaxID=3155008 RepID=UPI0033CDE702